MNPKLLVLNLLEEQALAVGGCVAAGDIPDPAVWRLMRALEAVGRRVLAGLEDGGGAPGLEDLHLDPHPAVEQFLANLRRA